MTSITAMTATTATGTPVLDPAGLRRVVREQCGFDPGPLAPQTPLAQAGLVGLARLRVIWWLESTWGIEFPADLVTAVETVDDLCHYAAVKLDQAGSGPAAGGAP